MSYKQHRADKYLNEIKQNLKLEKLEKPIIEKYYNEFRAKIKPTTEPIIDNLTDSEIRNLVISELSPVLKDQTVNFVENLVKTNDLMAFYKFSKLFLNSVKDIRNIDSAFLSDLWRKFKSKMLSNVEKTPPIEAEIIKPDEKLKKMYLEEKIINRPTKFKSRKYALSKLETADLEPYPKGVKGISHDVEHLALTNPFGYRKGTGKNSVEYTKIPRKGPANTSILLTSSGFPPGRPYKFSASNLKKYDARTGTYKKSTQTEPTAASTYEGSGIIGKTTYARR